MTVVRGAVTIFLPCFFGFISVTTLVLAWLLWGKRRHRLDGCSAHVMGEVIGPSAINYAGHHIPLVRYVVDGQSYKVAGPRFEKGTALPFAQFNVSDRNNPPASLVGPSIAVGSKYVSNDVLYELSPMSQLYPVGSLVDVYYDPANPRTAYVIRRVREGRGVGIVLLVQGVLFGIAALVVAAFV